MAYRATKSGFAAEAQEKNRAKYDETVAAEVMEWVSSTLRNGGDSTPVNTSPKVNDVIETLKDGYILVRLMNILSPRSIPEKYCKKRETATFKIMEIIGMFTEAMSKYGVQKTEIFQTVDLAEYQNMWQVILSLLALSRKAMSMGKAGVGPKESEKNVRHFTDEQLKAGDSIIGLQMGTNKGANQAGMNMGNTRHIVD